MSEFTFLSGGGGGGSGTGTVTSVTADLPLVVTGIDTITPNITIPAATASVSGYVTTDSQTFGGIKTFDSTPSCNNTPIIASDLVNKQYVDLFVGGLQIKANCATATTTNGTLSTAFTIGSTVGGYVLLAGDRILIKDQNTQSENGIYTPNASSSPTRATDYDTSAEVGAGTFTSILYGTNANKQYVQITPSPTLNSSALVFSLMPTSVISINTPLGGTEVGAVTLTSAKLQSAPLYSTIKSVATTTYTFINTDALNGTYVRFTSATSVTLTVQTNAYMTTNYGAAWTTGTQLFGIQAGAGTITIAGAVGVTIVAADSATKTRVQYSSFMLVNTGVNTWDLIGDITI